MEINQDIINLIIKIIKVENITIINSLIIDDGLFVYYSFISDDGKLLYRNIFINKDEYREYQLNKILQ